MHRVEFLDSLTFGERVAEQEIEQLQDYFVETSTWRRILDGRIDIVYGAKGSGKSAICALLVARREQLEKRGVAVVLGESPRGAPVFKTLQHNPPTTEQEFIFLWKLYLLCLVNEKLQQLVPSAENAQRIQQFLLNCKLIRSPADRKALLASIFDYVKSYFRKPASVESTVLIDPASGLATGITGKISFEASADDSAKDAERVDNLLALANELLAQQGQKVWILLDRLDVAFAESRELESNGLKALFRTYLDVIALDQIALKIFLRSDIWNRLASDGFREGSHITRSIQIEWNRDLMLNLIAKRLLVNDCVLNSLKVDADKVLGDIEDQFSLFYQIFPKHLDTGPNVPETFDWILKHTVDGFQKYTPREVIHFFGESILQQLRLIEIGVEDNELLSGPAFSAEALRCALPEVSRIRLEQTLFAEFPHIRDWSESLIGQSPTFTLRELCKIWNCSEPTATERAKFLKDIGLFMQFGVPPQCEYKVPYLYRPALKML